MKYIEKLKERLFVMITSLPRRYSTFYTPEESAEEEMKRFERCRTEFDKAVKKYLDKKK